MLKTSEQPESRCGKHWEEVVKESRRALFTTSLFSRCHQVKEVSQPFEQAFYKHCRSSSPFLFVKPSASCGNNGGKRRTASGEKKSRGIWLFHPIFQQQESNSTERNSRFSMRFSTIDEWKVENFENTRWLTVKNFQAFVVFPQWIQEFPQMNRILERKKVHFLKNFPENV